MRVFNLWKCIEPCPMMYALLYMYIMLQEKVLKYMHIERLQQRSQNSKLPPKLPSTPCWVGWGGKSHSYHSLGGLHDPVSCLPWPKRWVATILWSGRPVDLLCRPKLPSREEEAEALSGCSPSYILWSTAASSRDALLISNSCCLRLFLKWVQSWKGKRYD